MNVITRLSDEHDALRAHLERIQAAAESGNTAELTANLEAARVALTTELDTHIAAEEAEVFSVVAEPLGEGIVRQFYDEHGEIRRLRDQIYAQLVRGKAPLDASLNLCELILAHQQREDLMLFPSAREVIAQ